MSRTQGGPLQAIYEARGWSDDDPRDWQPGGPEGIEIRKKGGLGRPIPYLRVISDPHTPCWLCIPAEGYVCAFHRED